MTVHAISLSVAPFMTASPSMPLRAKHSITDPAVPALSSSCNLTEKYHGHELLLLFFFYKGMACEIYNVTKNRKSKGNYLNLCSEV